MKKILHLLLDKEPFRSLKVYSRKVVLPGFERVPLYDVALFFLKGMQKGSIRIRASSMSFDFFLAFFPAVIFLFTLIPYIPIENFQGQLLALIRDFLPGNAYEAARETIEDIIKHQRGGLLSFGFITALYFSTNGIHSMIDAFNQTHHSIETRSNFQQRLISILLTIILSLLVMIAVSLIIFSKSALDFLVTKGLLKDSFTFFLLLSGKWIIVVSLLFTAFAFLYYLGPSQKNKFKFVSAGASLATVLLILTSLGFTFFVNNFSQYNKLYGSIGTLLVILVWIHISSITLLIGFELNASIDHAKRGDNRPVAVAIDSRQ